MTGWRLPFARTRAPTPPMTVSTERVLRLLQPDHPVEVRCAAALVLGEVASRDGDVSEALTASLQDSDASVRARAIQAVGKLRIEAALPALLERIRNGEIDPSFVVTHRLPLSQAPHGYEIFNKKQDGCIKIVLKPGM